MTDTTDIKALREGLVEMLDHVDSYGGKCWLFPEDVRSIISSLDQLEAERQRADGLEKALKNEEILSDTRFKEVVDLYAEIAAQKGDQVPVALSVWYGSMPESNGKENWTAILHRKGVCISEGITVDRSEYPERVRYAADCMRYLIGEIQDEPDILAYDAGKRSDYVYPVTAPQKPVLPDELREDILRCVDDSMHGCNSISAPDYAVRVAGWLAAGGIVKDGE